MQDIIKSIEKKQMVKQDTEYCPGDTINVSFKIKEGDKERIQQFQGVIIQTRGAGISKTVTVRKASGNIYVERIFPVHSPLVSEVKVLKKGRVRRSKLFYLRDRIGKATRIKEKK